MKGSTTNKRLRVLINEGIDYEIDLAKGKISKANKLIANRKLGMVDNSPKSNDELYKIIKKYENIITQLIDERFTISYDMQL